jgi:uncharacterized membrane protein SirB2
MIYLALKHLHVSCVVLSGAGFLLRGFWMFGDSPQLQQRWVRVFPHVVDTLLLGSAITMAILSAQYPFVTGWLTAKLIGLLAYIVCGTVALKRGRTKQQRSVFFVIALFVYLYIVTVAVTRNPGGLLVWL